MFKLFSEFKPTGDQPRAVQRLVENLKSGAKHQVLLGVTGSGKTFTMAKVIERAQKPVLIVSHNKTLAAQLYQEFKEFFPENAVHYFVSYYDYYQPESYLPQTDTYIEKDAKINQEIDRLRHAAVQDLLTRKDIIIVASVSCIYSIGSPEGYQKVSLDLRKGKNITRQGLLSRLVGLRYRRNDAELKEGSFRVRGGSIEICLVTGQGILRIELEKGTIKELGVRRGATNSRPKSLDSFRLYPANFWIAPREKVTVAMENIKSELESRLEELKKKNELLEAQRLEERTNYDLEMLKESGYCHGIENYSRHMEFRKPGQAPFALLSYFPKGFLTFIDESHATLPQIRAMAVQDRARKESLIKYGFRLPSAADNRPLTFREFEKRVGQTVYVSATPSEYEKKKALQEKGKCIVEQLIRPTGLLEPAVEIRPTNNQIGDLMAEIKKRIKNKERVLVLTLTKRLAEAVADHLSEQKIKSRWLHAEIKALERPGILEGLRKGEFDVLVGINLLREGLDLPEVALVAILDADKEGFLRNETTLIQTMGRAARHPGGRVIMYADQITGSMKAAIKEVSRRRKIQQEYNKSRGIVPRPIVKKIRQWSFASAKKMISSEFGAIRDAKLLEKEIRAAIKKLDFERAAEIRDLIKEIKSGKKEMYGNH